MSRQIETDIFNFIQLEEHPPNSLRKILLRWRSNGFSLSDANIIGHFLYSMDALNELILFTIQSLEKDEPVSWYWLGKALKTIEPNTSARIYEALKSYISDQRKLDEFTSCELFDLLFPKEKEIKLAQVQAKVQLKERHRQTLLDQIRLFNQTRNYIIEKQAIQKFIRFFPNDKVGKDLLRINETEDLQRFYQRFKNEKKNNSKLYVETFSRDDLELLKIIREQLKRKISVDINSSSQGDDLIGYIYFFIFIEDFSSALNLIVLIPPSESRDWLHLDLLIYNNKLVDALAYFKYLDKFYSQSASYFAAKIYYTAQCYWGLGEQKKAVELMETLFQVRPDYRLTSFLLKDWKAET